MLRSESTSTRIYRKRGFTTFPNVPTQTKVIEFKTIKHLGQFIPDRQLGNPPLQPFDFGDIPDHTEDVWLATDIDGVS